MATDKQYSVVGVTKFKGSYKVRFGNDITRIKTLHKEGHEDIRLCELDGPMSKLAGVLAISDMTEFADVPAQCAINDWISTHASKYPDQPVAKKEKVTEMSEEDAPF